jgi:hypothetical protein
MGRAIAVPLEQRDELAAHTGTRRVPRHRAEDAGARPDANARHELRGVGRKLRVRSSERVNELVEVEKLLYVGASEDEHGPDGTAHPLASASPASSSFLISRV